MKKIAIYQPVYLPWKGYFDLINQVDIFVFLSDVAYTQHYFINRNKIVTPDSVKWITVPVKHSGRENQLICEAEIDNRSTWQRKHLNAFQMNYSKAPYFKQYKCILDSLYNENVWEKICDFNIYAIKLIAKILGIKTMFIDSIDLDAQGTKDDRVIDICKKLGGDFYISTPNAKNYNVPEKFEDSGIALQYMDFEYPQYQQLYGKEFDHYVTILDLIFNCGPNAPYYIWGWRE